MRVISRHFFCETVSEMTSVNADTISATSSLAIETGSRQAAVFTNDGNASLVLGDPSSAAYEVTVPYVPTNVVDHTDLFDARLAFTPADSNLGRVDGYDNEPFWELGGGAFHIRGTNHSTGGAVSYIFRIGAYDELEVVKKIEPVHGDTTYETVSKFGFKRRNEGAVMSDRGIINFVTAGSSVTLTTFMPYGEYKVLVGVSHEPLASQDLIQKSHNCFVADTVAPGADVTHSFNAVRTVDGEALAQGATYWLNAIVQENHPGGLSSTEPRTISFVI